jgi:hypothetical protein
LSGDNIAGLGLKGFAPWAALRLLPGGPAVQEAVGMPADLKAFIDAELAKLWPVVKAAGIEMEGAAIAAAQMVHISTY